MKASAHEPLGEVANDHGGAQGNSDIGYPCSQAGTADSVATHNRDDGPPCSPRLPRQTASRTCTNLHSTECPRARRSVGMQSGGLQSCPLTPDSSGRQDGAYDSHSPEELPRARCWSTFAHTRDSEGGPLRITIVWSNGCWLETSGVPLSSLHRDRGQGRYAWTVHDERKLLTAPELDGMSPDERAAAVNDRVVTDLDQLPSEFRDRVVATGRRLAVARTQTEE